MNSASPMTGSSSNHLLKFLLTGIIFLAAGFALWFAFLTIDLVSTLFSTSAHTDLKDYHSISLLKTPWGVALCYGSTFFIAALLVARRSYNHHPALAAFTAYIAYLVIHFSSFDWSHSSSPEIVWIMIPLLTSPLGGALAEHLFAPPGATISSGANDERATPDEALGE